MSDKYYGISTILKYLGDVLAMIVGHLGGQVALLSITRGIAHDSNVAIFMRNNGIRVKLLSGTKSPSTKKGTRNPSDLEHVFWQN